MRASSRDLKLNRFVRSPEGDHNSNWAISYGDMITLLLGFFLLFFNMSSDSYHIKAIEKNIKESFIPAASRKPDEVWGNVETASKTAPYYEANAVPEIKTTILGNKLIVEFPEVSFFQTARDEITSEGTKVLEKFSAIFKNKITDMRLIVRGYTDNRPLKKNWKYKDNLELSVARSLAAVRLLNENGIPLYLMRTGGYGETDKAQEISPEDQLKLDRKIVLVLEPLDQTERGLASIKTKEEVHNEGL